MIRLIIIGWNYYRNGKVSHIRLVGASCGDISTEIFSGLEQSPLQTKSYLIIWLHNNTQ